MKQYYYANGDQQLGPFTLQELQSKNLSKDTYVWYEGLSDWTRAGDLPEMSALFQGPIAQTQTPTTNQPLQQTHQPPMNQGGQQHVGNQGGYQQQQPMGQKPKTWLVESILATFFCCLPFGIAGIVFAAKIDSMWASGDYAGAQKASKDAKLWTTIAFGIGLAFWVFYILYIVVMIGSVGAF